MVSKTSPAPVAKAGAKISFKAQMLVAREEAIVQAVNRLLAEKGFDLMTVDEVAAEVGIAKASLYKHFPSKEDLGAAAMVRVVGQAQAFLDSLPPDAAPLCSKHLHPAGWLHSRRGHNDECPRWWRCSRCAYQGGRAGPGQPPDM